MAKTPNRLDQAAKLLRDQVHDIDREMRELQRAKDRILRALKPLIPDNPTGGPPNGNRERKYTRVQRGPNRTDSHYVLHKALKANYAEGHVFKFQDAVRVGVEAGLRTGQAHGAVQTCYDQGMIFRVKKGHYYWGRENGGNGSAA